MRNSEVKSESINLTPNSPVDFVIDDHHSLQLFTGGGKYIGTIRTVPGGVVILNGSNKTLLAGLTFMELGINSMGADFFGNSANFVSGEHIDIAIVKYSQGGTTVRLTDLNSTNGSACLMLKDIDQPQNTPAPEIGAHLEASRNQLRQAVDLENPQKKARIVAGGAVGELFSDSRKSKGLTIRGNRKNNEDGFMVADNAIAVADGMGGYEKGEVACKISLEVAGRQVSKARIDLRDLFYSSCNEIAKQNLPGNCGTTLAIVRKLPAANGMSRYEAVHAGDTKILTFSRKKRSIVYESIDDSRVQKLIERKILDPVERYSHPDNSTITNSIWTKGLKHPPSYQAIEWQNDDLVAVIYSDGVADYVTPEEVMELYFEMFDESPRRAAEYFIFELAKLALSRQKKPTGFDIKLNGKKHHITIEGDGGDNITVALME